VYYAREDVALKAIGTHLRSDRRLRPRTLGAVAAVCLLLLALLAVAQVTHVHAIGSDADHCQLCVVMHSVVPLMLLVTAVVLVRIGAAEPPLHKIQAAIWYWHPTMFSRPPPACL